MISWIQRTFQRHFRVVFAVLLGITIISFIVTIGATPGIGRGDHVLVTREFFGHNLISRGEMQQLNSDAALSVELQAGYSGMDEQQIEKYALERVAALHLADEWHLPPPTALEEVDFIKGLRIFGDEKGAFDSNRYDAFRRSLQSNSRTSEADISRVIAEDVRILSVRKLLDGPGYVLPADVKTGLVRADTLWTLDVATVDYASFKPENNPTDAELAKYYQENSLRYQIPPRVSAGYVDFPAADYLGEVKATDAEIRPYYDSNPARFPAPKKPESAPAPKNPGAKPAPTIKNDPNADFAAVRPQVEAALKLDRAKNLAAKAASDLAYALYQAKISPGPALLSFLSARHLPLKPLAPFSQEAGPPELGGSTDIAAAAFKLDAQQYFSEAVPTPSGAAILIWKEALPSRTPLLTEVRSKVLADYTENEKRKRFVDLGRVIHDIIAAYMKAGVPFQKAAAAAGAAQSVKIETKTLPAFALRSRPKDVSQTVLGTLENLNKGSISNMAIDADKGYLVYAADRKSPNLNEAGPDFTAMRMSIASYMARLGANDYLGEIVAAELKRSEPVAR